MNAFDLIKLHKETDMCASTCTESKASRSVKWLSQLWEGWQDSVCQKHVLNASMISFLAFSAPVAAQTGEWKVFRSVDQMTDQEIVNISESNKDAYTLSMHIHRNWLYIRFSTPENCICVIDVDRIGLLRFDDKAPIDLGDEHKDDIRSGDGNTHVLVSQNWIMYRVFPLTFRNNGEHISVVGSMKAFVEAHRLLLRYFTLDGRSHDVEFAMAGSLHALHEAYGLPMETKPDDEDGLRLYVDANFYKPCAEHAQSKACASVKTECYPLLYNASATKLQTCINNFFGFGWQKAGFGK